MSFTAPVSDQRLTLNAVVGIGDLPGGPDAETVDAVLEGAAALAEGEFAPLLRVGDTVGARWDNGTVTMPPGYKEAWRSFVEGGWMSLAAPEEHEGQGLPLSLAAALMEDPQLAQFGGRVSDSGEGRWTMLAAVDEGVPVHVLSASLIDRFESRGAAEFANKLLSAMRKQFGGHAEKSVSSA